MTYAFQQTPPYLLIDIFVFLELPSTCTSLLPFVTFDILHLFLHFHQEYFIETRSLTLSDSPSNSLKQLYFSNSCLNSCFTHLQNEQFLCPDVHEHCGIYLPFHVLALLLPFPIFPVKSTLTALSRIILNSRRDRTHPCLTPASTQTL